MTDLGDQFSFAQNCATGLGQVRVVDEHGALGFAIHCWEALGEFFEVAQKIRRVSRSEIN